MDSGVDGDDDERLPETENESVHPTPSPSARVTTPSGRKIPLGMTLRQVVGYENYSSYR